MYERVLFHVARDHSKVHALHLYWLWSAVTTALLSLGRSVAGMRKSAEHVSSGYVRCPGEISCCHKYPCPHFLPTRRSIDLLSWFFFLVVVVGGTSISDTGSSGKRAVPTLGCTISCFTFYLLCNVVPAYPARTIAQHIEASGTKSIRSPASAHTQGEIWRWRQKNVVSTGMSIASHLTPSHSGSATGNVSHLPTFCSLVLTRLPPWLDP
jgi:hypothetical protein